MTLYKNCYFIFILGGIGYSLLEILWRGYTHPSMAVVGGICLISIYFINGFFIQKSRIFRALCCSVAITVIEFFSGVLLNLILKLNVWSYSDRALNIMGQICILYSLLWFLLSYTLIFATEKLRHSLPQSIQRKYFCIAKEHG